MVYRRKNDDTGNMQGPMAGPVEAQWNLGGKDQKTHDYWKDQFRTDRAFQKAQVLDSLVDQFGKPWTTWGPNSQ